MAKGQKHSNREVKKPKQNKKEAKDPASLGKTAPSSVAITTKKG